MVWCARYTFWTILDPLDLTCPRDPWPLDCSRKHFLRASVTFWRAQAHNLVAFWSSRLLTAAVGHPCWWGAPTLPWGLLGCQGMTHKWSPNRRWTHSPFLQGQAASSYSLQYPLEGEPLWLSSHIWHQQPPPSVPHPSSPHSHFLGIVFFNKEQYISLCLRPCFWATQTGIGVQTCLDFQSITPLVPVPHLPWESAWTLC